MHTRVAEQDSAAARQTAGKDDPNLNSCFHLRALMRLVQVSSTRCDRGASPVGSRSEI